jgi:alpha-mannosidase
MKIRANLNLPASLTEDRYSRDEYLTSNLIDIYITVYKEIKRIDFKIELENNSKDHRIRVLFPSKIKSKKIDADGHFYVISRDVEMPKSERWAQQPVPTNHQKDFVSISDTSRTFSVINKGLPEYEAVINKDGTISLAITLLRCIEWLSRHDFTSRRSNAGPDLNTPEAQCLGKQTFELSLVIEGNKPNWLDSNAHIKSKEFNNPFEVVVPSIVRTSIRASNKVVLAPFGLISYFKPATRQPLKPYLPTKLSFLEIDNKNVMLSALKKSEKGESLIVRIYNISPTSQKARLTLHEKTSIKSADIVNFLEEKPENEIKAKIDSSKGNYLDLTLEPNVIVTIKLELDNNY